MIYSHMVKERVKERKIEQIMIKLEEWMRSEKISQSRPLASSPSLLQCSSPSLDLYSQSSLWVVWIWGKSPLPRIWQRSPLNRPSDWRLGPVLGLFWAWRNQLTRPACALMRLARALMRLTRALMRLASGTPEFCHLSDFHPISSDFARFLQSELKHSSTTFYGYSM